MKEELKNNGRNSSKQFLFFDIESATGKAINICEFGYVLTNENLEVIEENNILINPKSRFSSRVLNEILTYDRYIYESQKPFSTHYDFIRKLILNSDMVFGFAVVNDVVYLNNECNRYNKQSINYQFVDIRKIIGEYSPVFHKSGLIKAMNLANIEHDGNMHNAKDDAYNSMKLLKYVLDDMKISIAELLNIIPSYIDETCNGFVKSVENNKELKNEKNINYIKSSNKLKGNTIDCFNNYIDIKSKEAELSNECDHPLFGKNICFGSRFERTHAKQMFNIVNMLAKKGAKYVKKASLSDVFVTNDNKDIRLSYANNKKAEIKNIDDFMQLLGVSVDYLDTIEFPKDIVPIKKVKEEKEISYLGSLLNEYLKEEKICLN